MPAAARRRCSSLGRGLLMVLLLPLAACTATPLRLYEGPTRGPDALAVVSLPEQLEVARVNGAELPAARGLWQRGDQQIELLPGHYELLVFYREFWDIGSQEQVLRSDPARFIIDATAGGRYQLDYVRPRNFREAQQLQADFRGWVDDGHGQRLASTPSGLQFRRDWAAALGNRDQLLAQSSGVAAVSAASAAGPTREPDTASARALADMQACWKQASAQERSAFLQWLATQTP